LWLSQKTGKTMLLKIANAIAANHPGLSYCFID
jgi:transcription termination factor Rho